MDNVLRLQAREGGAFNASQNRMTFSIPADNTWDLANSYVSLMGRITAVGDPNAIYAVCLRYIKTDGTISQIAPPPACIVKNSRLTSSRWGIMEDIHRPDIYFSNISTLEMSVADVRGKSNQYPVVPFENNNNKGSVWRELHREGDVRSRDLVAPFKLPLSQCLALGKSTLDTTALGRLDLFLELQLDRFKAEQLLTSGSNFGNADDEATFFKQMEDITGVGEKSTLTTKYKFDRLEESPYHIGQSLEIVVGTQGTTVLNPPAFVIITGIEWVRSNDEDTNGQIILTFDTYATFLDVDTSWTNVRVEGRDAESIEFSVEYAEITLQGSSEKVDMKGGLTYSTITTEEDNGLALKRFRKQYFLEPECYNLWVCFPDEDNDLGSNMTDITNWRLRLDGEDLTNRDVVKNSPLDYDRISMTMLNGGRQLKSLIGSIAIDDSQSEIETFSDTSEAKMICNPVPITSVRKLIDFSIDATEGGVNKITLFKEVSKTIKM